MLDLVLFAVGFLAGSLAAWAAVRKITGRFRRWEASGGERVRAEVPFR